VADKNTEKDREFREAAATILGMRDEEIVSSDGTVVTLHDGTRFDVDVDGKSYREVLPGDKPPTKAADAEVRVEDLPRGPERPAETADTSLTALEKATDDGSAPATDAMARPFEVPNTDVAGGTEDADRPTGDRTAPGSSRTSKRKA
jgi:hypothetical protein